jgi:hypothetical protein
MAGADCYWQRRSVPRNVRWEVGLVIYSWSSILTGTGLACAFGRKNDEPERHHSKNPLPRRQVSLLFGSSALVRVLRAL